MLYCPVMDAASSVSQILEDLRAGDKSAIDRRFPWSTRNCAGWRIVTCGASVRAIPCEHRTGA